MKNKIKFAMLLTVICASSSLYAYPLNFVGIWKNTNPQTRGIVRLVITPDLNMRMYGACSPIPCDNGISKLISFGKTVTDVNHKAAIAHYDMTFKKVGVTLKLANNNKITFEHYNQFTDSSGRQNYMMSESFKRIVPYELEDINEFNNLTE